MEGKVLHEIYIRQLSSFGYLSFSHIEPNLSCSSCLAKLLYCLAHECLRAEISTLASVDFECHPRKAVPEYFEEFWGVSTTQSFNYI